MKKGLLVAVIGILLLATVTAQCPSSQEVLKDKMTAQGAFFAARLQERMIALKSVIAATGNSTEGLKLADLSTQLGTQQTTAEQAVEQDDEQRFQDTVSQAQVLLVKIRTLIKNAPEDMAWRKTMNDAVQERQPYLTNLIKEANHNEDTYFMTEFDAMVCQYGAVVDTLNETRFDKNRFENIVDDTRMKRKNFLGALQQARDACQALSLATCREKAAKDFLGFAKGLGEQFQSIKDEILNKGEREEWGAKIATVELNLNTTMEELNKTVNSSSFGDLKQTADRLAERLLSAKQRASDKLFNRTQQLLDEIQAQLPSFQEKIAEAIHALPNESITTNTTETNVTDNTTMTNDTATNTTNNTG